MGVFGHAFSADFNEFQATTAKLTRLLSDRHRTFQRNRRRTSTTGTSMALAFIGRSSCGICGKSVDSADDARLFPAFAFGEGKGIEKFSDGVFHRQCVDAHPDGAMARRASEEFLTAIAPTNRICCHCGLAVENADEHAFFSYMFPLTSEHASLNYLHFHRRCFAKWPDANTLIKALSELEGQGYNMKQAIHLANQCLRGETENKPDFRYATVVRG
jgi:endogenous inhibitor of DNA gyrase (YacG/DUF329 family)